MAFPKEVTRVTKHKNPRYELYQPGFNEGNGCWLEGSWVAFPFEEWANRKRDHLQMYEGLRERTKRQHYRDPAVPPEKMGSAQRQAWNHFSGTGTVYCKGEGGGVGPVYINLAAGKIRKDSVAWLQESGRKVLQWVKMPDGTLVDQQADFGIPDAVVEVCSTPHEPPDPWKSIIEQNKSREDEMLDAFLGDVPPELVQGLAEMDSSGVSPTTANIFGSMGDFMSMMAFQSLIMLEEGIVRAEWDKQRGQPDKYTDLDLERVRYVEARKKLQAKFNGQFEMYYTSIRASHNDCARTNLDNSQGHLYSFVLPVFHADGTHEPWGEKDVPWGQV